MQYLAKTVAGNEVGRRIKIMPTQSYIEDIPCIFCISKTHTLVLLLNGNFGSPMCSSGQSPRSIDNI